MAIYADPERGRYPVWQSLDHPNFFPGSRIIFVTVTVGDPIRTFPELLKDDLEIIFFDIERFFVKNRGSFRCRSEE